MNLSPDVRNSLVHTFTVKERGTVIFIKNSPIEGSFMVGKYIYNASTDTTFTKTDTKLHLYSWIDSAKGPVTLVDIVGRTIITNSPLAKQMEFFNTFDIKFITIEKSWINHIENITNRKPPQLAAPQNRSCTIL